MFKTERINEAGETEIAICPLCNLRVEFMGAPMVRCYSTGETYERDEIVWTRKSAVSEKIGYDVENIRGNDKVQDFLPNAHPAQDEIEA
jgi:tRNA(Ile2) C34 agmatinyltransferase TiaS